ITPWHAPLELVAKKPTEDIVHVSGHAGHTIIGGITDLHGREYFNHAGRHLFDYGGETAMATDVSSDWPLVHCGWCKRFAFGFWTESQGRTGKTHRPAEGHCDKPAVELVE